MIRSVILKETLGNRATWSDRRELIDSIHIRKIKDFPAFIIDNDIQQIINDIANGKGELHS